MMERDALLSLAKSWAGFGSALAEPIVEVRLARGVLKLAAEVERLKAGLIEACELLASSTDVIEKLDSMFHEDGEVADMRERIDALRKVGQG